MWQDTCTPMHSSERQRRAIGRFAMQQFADPTARSALKVLAKLGDSLNDDFDSNDFDSDRRSRA